MIAYFSYLVMGLHLKCSQKLMQVFVFFKCLNYWCRDNPIGANKIRVVLLLTTYEIEAGDTTLFKGVYVDYVWKKQIREENKCFNNTMVLAHKGQFAVFSNKESQHIRTLISSLPSEVHDSQHFFCIFRLVCCVVFCESVFAFLSFFHLFHELSFLFRFFTSD
jgi:hypothetical protein